MKTIHDRLSPLFLDSEIVSSLLNGYFQAMIFCDLGPDSEDYEKAQTAIVDDTVSAIITGRVTAFYHLFCDKSFGNFQKLDEIVKDPAIDYDWTNVGMDLYYSSYGAGTGFWDRNQLRDNDLGQKIQRFVDRYFDFVGAGSLYIGDDGILYL